MPVSVSTSPASLALLTSSASPRPWPSAAQLQAVAEWLAAQPWRTVACGVLLVWLLGAVGWYGWRRVAPGVRMARALASLGIVGAGAGVVLLLWAWPHADGVVGRFDDALVLALATGVSAQQLQAWAWLTHAGDALTLCALALVVALVLWRLGESIGLLVWLGGLAGNGLVTRLLKMAVERQRPLHEHGLAVVESGSSFPSGHASASVVAWGLLAWLLARRLPGRWHAPLALGAAGLVLLVGWSRVLLQVHHASDVLAGWFTGGAWLLGCVLLATALAESRAERSAEMPADASIETSAEKSIQTSIQTSSEKTAGRTRGSAHEAGA